MTAPALQHAAARAAESLMAAIREAPLLEERLTEVATDLAALHQDLEAKDGQLADLRESCCALAQEKVALEADVTALRESMVRDLQYIQRLEQADSRYLLTISDLKARLAAASREVEQLLQRASIRLQAETADFNQIRGIRDTLDPTITTLPGGALLQRMPAEPHEPRTAAGR